MGSSRSVSKRNGEVGVWQVASKSMASDWRSSITTGSPMMRTWGDLVKELGAEDRVLYRATRTGMYFANNFFKLSSPLDVLRFTPLSFANRIRLGLLALRARAVRDWKELEALTAEEWLVARWTPGLPWSGSPLLHGKFGPFASQISAVWFGTS